MAKKDLQKELPKGFISIDKFNGKFTPNGSQFEFSKPVRLSSETMGIVEGVVYRYALAPKQLYFVSHTGERLQDINGFSFAKEEAKEDKTN